MAPRMWCFCAFSLANVLFATAACHFSPVRATATSAPAALASLLFEHQGPRFIEKTQRFATSLTFFAHVELLASDSTRMLIFLLVTWLMLIFLLVTWLLCDSAFQLYILSEVRLLNFLRLYTLGFRGFFLGRPNVPWTLLYLHILSLHRCMKDYLPDGVCSHLCVSFLKQDTAFGWRGGNFLSNAFAVFFFTSLSDFFFVGIFGERKHRLSMSWGGWNHGKTFIKIKNLEVRDSSFQFDGEVGCLSFTGIFWGCVFLLLFSYGKLQLDFTVLLGGNSIIWHHFCRYFHRKLPSHCRHFLIQVHPVVAWNLLVQIFGEPLVDSRISWFFQHVRWWTPDF